MLTVPSVGLQLLFLLTAPTFDPRQRHIFVPGVPRLTALLLLLTSQHALQPENSHPLDTEDNPQTSDMDMKDGRPTSWYLMGDRDGNPEVSSCIFSSVSTSCFCSTSVWTPGRPGPTTCPSCRSSESVSILRQQGQMLTSTLRLYPSLNPEVTFRLISFVLFENICVQHFRPHPCPR